MKTVISPCLSISGFACNGKTTLIQKCIVQGWYVFEEPVRYPLTSLQFLCRDLNIYEYPQIYQGSILGCSLYALHELIKLKFHSKFINLIVSDRNLIDVLSFSILKGVLTKKECQSFLSELLKEINDAWTVVDDLVIPIFDVVYHIQACTEEDFINENCLSDIRKSTITSDVDYFISQGIEFDEIFEELITYTLELQNSYDYQILLIDKYQYLKQLPNETYSAFLNRVHSFIIQDIEKIERYFQYEIKNYFNASGDEK